MNKRTRRRNVRFQRIDDILPEVRRLLEGHRTVGRWSLAQICRHLADTIDGSIDGFDLSVHRFKRRWFRRLLWRYTLWFGIPHGYTVNAQLTPPAHSDIEDSVRRLEQALARYASYTGALQPHPLFGVLSRREWDRMHCIHAAHHLGFAVPV